MMISDLSRPRFIRGFAGLLARSLPSPERRLRDDAFAEAESFAPQIEASLHPAERAALFWFILGGLPLAV